ncbi:MAG: helix-turn-helix transcriptional regulator [Rhodobacterales bacterium]
MTHDTPLFKNDLIKFFRLKPAKNDDYRALSRVLKALGIRLVGGTTRWPVIWLALGLAGQQDPMRAAELKEALLDAQTSAALIGVDPSIIYRWSKGRVPARMPPFPTAIDLSKGRKNARCLRWRRAEVLAWHSHQTLPAYARLAPAFGSLTPKN